MLRLALVLSLIGGVAVAAPKDGQTFDPLKQVTTPNGTFKDEDADATDAEIAEFMWKKFAGDKPMPDHLRKKYGLPDKQRPLPAGR